MANVLTDLAADIYKAANIVGRERVGMIPSSTINAGGERAAKGDSVKSAFTAPSTVDTTYAPSMTIPEGTDQTVTGKTLTLNQFASVKIPWTGEDVKHVKNGAGFETIYGDQIAEAMRAITNAIEAYVFGIAYKSASRAIGTAGTTPFASNIDTIAEVRQILIDNGCPDSPGALSLVMSTSAGTNLRNIANLQKVNEAGSDSLLRQGVLADLQGIMMRETAGVALHTKGTGTLYDINNGAGYAVGDTDLVLDGGTVGGTGIIAGDVVTFAGDTNKYIVKTGLAAVSGTIVLNSPGMQATVADTVEMTIGGDFTPNIAFHRNAIEIAVRPPAMPNGGDSAVDTLLVQDPWSGLSFEIAAYKGYMKSMFDIRCVYDAKAWKDEHIALLLG